MSQANPPGTPPGAPSTPDPLAPFWHLLIEHMPIACIVSGPDFRYTYWNPAAEKLFGYAQADILGKHPCDVLVPADNRAAVEQVFDRLRQGEATVQGTCENLTSDGRTIVCEWHNTALRDPAGTFVGRIAMAVDVTERRLIEEQLLQSQKMEALGRLAGGLAHDFNNLLTVVNGCSELVLRQLRPKDPARALVEEILQAGERGATLTRKLLTFSRRQTQEPRVLDLNLLLHDMRTIVHRLIGENIKLAWELEPALGMVKADPGQMEQVVMNLVVNARDAMPEGGSLTLRTRNADREPAAAGAPRERGVLLEVIDTGVGMDDATRARVFEPFFTTKKSTKGTGLGLATVYGIVRAHNGIIEVESESGHGSTFRICLPRQQEIVVGKKSHHGVPMIPMGSETILLVEDEPTVRSLARRVLEMCGYHVLEASQGEEALEVAGKHAGPIHLLLTDILMPGMTGRQLAAELTTQRADLPVLFMSGYSDDILDPNGEWIKDIPLLPKPFTPDDLAHKVREMLGSGGGMEGGA